MVDTAQRWKEDDFADADRLLPRVAAGDRGAFEALYRDTAPTLLGICLRVLPDRAEAEDVLQEVFVSVWGKAAQFDARRARAIGWLCSIARHRAIDRLRALPAPAARAPITATDEVADPGASPAERAESEFERARLDECIEQLAPRHQALIRTAFFEGASYSELSTRTGSPLGSIKSWIRRALAQLKDCLDA